MSLADTETRKFWARNNTPGKKGFQPKSASNPGGDAPKTIGGPPSRAELDSHAWHGDHVLSVESAKAAGVLSPGTDVMFAGFTHNSGFPRSGEGARWDPGIVTKHDSRGITIRHPLDADRTMHVSSQSMVRRPVARDKFPRPVTLPEIDRATLGSKRAEKRWASHGGPPPMYD